MTRPYRWWTPERDEQLEILLKRGLSNVRVAQLMGRTVSGVIQRKARLGLVSKPETCLHCQAVIIQPKTGHPRRYCTNACADEAHRQRRHEVVAAETEVRRGRICECVDCPNPLPTNSAQRRFCSRLCSERTRTRLAKAATVTPEAREEG